MKKIAVIITGIAGAGALSLAGMGIASAATNTGDIGKSGIPRSVFRQERLSAAAQVLNTTPANLQAARKDKTVSSLISNAGLTKKEFAQKVKTALISDLEAKGYSQDQITIALHHKAIARLHHKAKSMNPSAT